MKKAKVTHLNKNNRFRELANLSYPSLFEHLIDGVLIVNSLGLVEYVNPAYEKMFGVSNFAFRGKSIYQTINDEIVVKSLKTQRSVQGYLDLPIKHKKFHVSSSLLIEHNVFSGVIAIYREEKEQPFTFKNSVLETSVDPCLSDAFIKVIGKSKVIKEVLVTAEKAAKSGVTVLITGDTGSGKGMVAEAIHKASKQKDKPFVKVNCGAIPYNLLESELFGHEQGAFTGAIKRKIGKFEQANGGTIFLDEIGDMPLDMQVKVLRVIQEKEFERVGGIENIKSEVRIIAATHRDLREMIKEGTFREDLYYRLNVIPIHVPPLSERKEDIIDLCYHIMGTIQKESGVIVKVLDEEVEKAFLNYSWPGNIRELKNLLERLMILVDGNTIMLSDLPKEISNTYQATLNTEGNSLINLSLSGELATLDDYEREIIEKALDKFGSFNKVAKALGITHKTVAAKARKFNIVE